MFPTHVGMNRGLLELGSTLTNVPHTRGDEPELAELAQDALLCSPHTWG